MLNSNAAPPTTNGATGGTPSPYVSVCLVSDTLHVASRPFWCLTPWRVVSRAGRSASLSPSEDDDRLTARAPPARSLVPQCVHRRDGAGAACGNVPGRQDARGEDERRNRRVPRIHGTDAVERA